MQNMIECMQDPTTFIEDPLRLTEGWISESDSTWPKLYITDISDYLRDKEYLERNRVINEYKDGKAYRYFVEGWLQEILTRPSSNLPSVTIMYSKCYQSYPSTKLSPYQVWVAVHKDGNILKAYCECAAGLQGTCNHVMALLFKIEALVRITRKSCTSVKCAWNMPRGHNFSEPTPVCDVSIRPQKFSKQKIRPMVSAIRKKFKPLTSVPKTNPEKRKDLLNGLIESHPEYLSVDMLENELKSVSISHGKVEPRLDIVGYIREMYETRQPLVLNTLPEDHQITEKTRDDVRLWKKARCGRITASVCNRIRTRQISLSDENSSYYKDGDASRVVNVVMGYTSPDPDLFLLKKGRELEPMALELYEIKNAAEHVNMEIRKTGLHLHPKHLYIAATPDSLVNCKCCGNGLVEVKCAVSLMKENYKTWSEVKTLPVYLHRKGNNIILKRNCGYFYQIMCQLACCQRSWCDLVLYLPHQTGVSGDIHVQRLYFDAQKWFEAEEILTRFYISYILPEITSEDYMRELYHNEASVEESDSDNPVQDLQTQTERVSLCTICKNVVTKVPRKHFEKGVICTICQCVTHTKCAKVSVAMLNDIRAEKKPFVCIICQGHKTPRITSRKLIKVAPKKIVATRTIGTSTEEITSIEQHISVDASIAPHDVVDTLYSESGENKRQLRQAIKKKQYPEYEYNDRKKSRISKKKN